MKNGRFYLAIIVMASLFLLVALWQIFGDGVDCPSGTERIETAEADIDIIFCQKLVEGTGVVREGPYVELFRGDGLKAKFFPQRKLEANYLNGKRHGPMTEWLANGQKRYEAHYADGNLDGTYAVYGDNGLRTYEANYSAGVVDGLQINYYNNGKPRTEEQFVKGQREGVYKLFTEDGLLRESGTYVKGVRSGLASVFSATGAKIQEGQYRNNKRTGMWLQWSDSGDLLGEAEYVEDQMVSQVQGYYEKDKPKRKIFFEKGMVKRSVDYHPDGRKKEETSYENNKILKRQVYN